MNRIRIQLLILVGLLGSLILLDAGLLRWLGRHRYRYIVVHHTASTRDNYASIKRLHRRRLQQRDAAYHLILSNGSTSVPRGYLEATGRYRHLSYGAATRNYRYNLMGIQFCIVGDFERRTPDDDLAAAAGNALRLLMHRYHIPLSRVVLHRDVSATKCPGRHVTRRDVAHWVRDLADRCPPGVQNQQRRVVEACGFTWHTLPRRWRAILGLLDLLVLAGGILIWRRFRAAGRLRQDPVIPGG